MLCNHGQADVLVPSGDCYSKPL